MNDAINPTGANATGVRDRIKSWDFEDPSQNQKMSTGSLPGLSTRLAKSGIREDRIRGFRPLGSHPCGLWFYFDPASISVYRESS